MLFSNLDPYHLFILTFERPFWSRLQNRFELLSDHRVILCQHAGHGQELQRILPHRAVDQGRTGIVIHVETHLKRNRLSCWLIGWVVGLREHFEEIMVYHGLVLIKWRLEGGLVLLSFSKVRDPYVHEPTQKHGKNKGLVPASSQTLLHPLSWLMLTHPTADISTINPVVSTPLKNLKVSWDDYSQHMEK